MMLSTSPYFLENDLEELHNFGKESHTILPQRHLIIQFLGNDYTIHLKVNQKVSWKDIGKTIIKEYKKIHIFEKEKLKLANNIHVSSVWDIRDGIELNINDEVIYRPNFLSTPGSSLITLTNSSKISQYNRYKLIVQSNIMLFPDDAIIQILLKFLIIPPSHYTSLSLNNCSTNKSTLLMQSIELVKTMNSLIRVNKRFHRIFTSDLIWSSIAYPGDFPTLVPLFNYSSYNRIVNPIDLNSEETGKNEVDLLDFSNNSPISKDIQSNSGYNLLEVDEMNNPLSTLDYKKINQDDILFNKSLNAKPKQLQNISLEKTKPNASLISKETINTDSKFSSWYGSGYMGNEKDMWDKIRDDSGLPVISVYRLRYMAHNTSRVRLFYGSLRPPEIKNNIYSETNIPWFKKIIPKFSSILSPSLGCMGSNDNYEINNSNSSSTSPTFFRVNNQYNSIATNNNFTISKNIYTSHYDMFNSKINTLSLGLKEFENNNLEDIFSINKSSNSGKSSQLNPYYMTSAQSTSPYTSTSNVLPSSPQNNNTSYLSTSSIGLISNTILLIGLNKQNISSKFISLLHYLLPISVFNFHYHPLCKPLLPGGILKDIKKSPRNSHSSKLEKDPGTRVETDALGEIIYQRLGDNRLTFLQFFYTPLLRSIIKNGSEGLTKILLNGKKDINDVGINMLYEEKKFFYSSPYNTFNSLNSGNNTNYSGSTNSNSLNNSISFNSNNSNNNKNYNISSLSKSLSNNNFSSREVNTSFHSSSVPTSPVNSNPSSPNYYTNASSPPTSYMSSPNSSANQSPININYTKGTSVSEYTLKNNPWILLSHQALGYIFFFEYSTKEKDQMATAINDMIQIIINNYRIRNKPILIYVGFNLIKDHDGKDIIDNSWGSSTNQVSSTTTTSSSLNDEPENTVQNAVEFICNVIKRNVSTSSSSLSSGDPIIKDCPWYVQPIDLNSIESCFQYSYSYNYSTKPGANMKKGYYAGLNWLIRSLLQGKET